MDPKKPESSAQSTNDVARERRGAAESSESSFRRFSQALDRAFNARFGRFSPYIFATGVVFIAFAIKLITPHSILHEIPFLIFFSAVVVAGMYGGYGPGLYATFLSGLLADYFFLLPTGMLIKSDWHEGFKVGIFILDCASTAVLCGYLKDALMKSTRLEKSQALAYRSLEMTEDQLQLALQNARMGIWHYNLDDHRSRATGNTATLLGVPAIAGDMLELLWSSVHPDDRAEAQRVWSEAKAARSPYYHEFRIIRPDGRTRWLFMRATARLDTDGVTQAYAGLIGDFTDRKETEMALLFERQKMETIFRVSPGAMVLWRGPEHRFEISNAAYQARLGNRELLGHQLLEALPELRDQPFAREVDQVFQTGAPAQGIEVPAKLAHSKNGALEERYYDYTCVRIDDAEGRPYGVFNHSLDVTDRVLSRRRVEESEERLRLALRGGQLGAFSVIMPSFQLIADESFKQMHGIRSGETIGEAIRRVVHPDDAGRVYHDLNASFESKMPYACEYRVVLADGNRRWIYSRGEPTYDSDFRAKSLTGVSLDITERKVAELRQAELSAITEASQDFIGLVDLSGKLIFLNLAGQALTGLRAAQVSSTKMIDLISVHDRAIAQNLIERLEKGASFTEEIRFRNFQTGELVPVSWSGFVVLEPLSGKPAGYGMVTRDMSSQVRAKRDLEIAKVDAERASQAKSAFLANMSHEIRTPLGAILGFVSLLKDSGLSPEESANYLSIIDRNSHHLLRIIDDILDLAKVEAGRIAVECIQFSLVDLLTDFESIVSLRAREHGIQFEFKAVGLLPQMVISDPTRIRQILSNILSNAIKFTDRGLVELTVGFDGRALSFRVRDTGRGISEDQRQKLFQAFVQADSSTTREFGGTGLGLVLTKKLAQALGGDFQLLESELGKGSVFAAQVAVELPAGVPMVNVQGNIAAVEPKPVALPTDLTGLRILLVEDSPDNRVLIQNLLKRTGASITTANDGVEGVEKALSQKFDVVLMDIQMPRMDGHEAVRKLRASGYEGVVVALTAHAMKEERERSKESGFSFFLSKPIDRRSLLNLLEELREGSVAVLPTREIEAHS